MMVLAIVCSLSTTKGSCYITKSIYTVDVSLYYSCTVDQFVLPNLTYNPNLLAYVEAHVFKFADRTVLDFQCAISICLKDDGGCNGVTVSEI